MPKLVQSHKGRLCEFEGIKYLAWDEDWMLNESTNRSERHVEIFMCGNANVNRWVPKTELEWIEE